MPSLIDDYLSFVEGSDECSMFVHRWCITTALSAFLGRRVKLPFGSSNIYPNLYVKIIGPAGCRKSTGIRKVKKFLQEATSFRAFAFEQTSKEKFLQDLATGAFVQHESIDDFSLEDLRSNEVFIVADEFNDFLGPNNVPFCSLLGNLWDYEGIYKPSFKTSGTLIIKNPTVTLLGGNTHEALQDVFPAHLIGQGFTSRIIFVAASSNPRKLAWPASDKQDFSSFTEKMLRIESLFYHPIEVSPEARDSIAYIYNTYKPIKDNRFAHYSSRRHIQFLKLCIISALANYRTTIEQEDVVYSNTLLTYTETRMPIALGEYGRAKSSPVAMRVMSLLSNPPGIRLSTKELWANGCSNELDEYAKFGDYLTGMLVAEKIKLDKRVNKWYLNDTREELNGKFIDTRVIPEILKENFIV